MTTSAPPAIAAMLPHLPESPGVYIWKDATGKVLYVGKSRSLRSRVRSYYMAETQRASTKTAVLMRQVAGLETIVVPTEESALILEANLIKEHRPRFNITLRDDKSYPWIKVTVGERYPRVLVTRRVLNDGSRYFGPYTDVGAMRRSMTMVNRVFTVRSCNYNLPTDAPERPCLDYHIGRCLAPCVGLQSEESHREMIREVLAFLSGRPEEAKRRVSEMMRQASENLDFERAAHLRDAVRELDNMQESTVVTQFADADCDVIGMARDGDDACVAILRVRDGKLLAREHRLLEHVEEESDTDILSAFMVGGYMSLTERSRDVLMPLDLPDSEVIERVLLSARLLVPRRGPRRELVDLAEQNARHLLEEFKLSTLEVDERATDPIYELARVLELTTLPRSTICFDISTTQGTDTTGSCVWFENGRPRRSEYRKFRVKTVVGTDDFASMAEVVTRYFSRRIEAGKQIPDLVVVDGGKGQLSAARAALDQLGLHTLTAISLAKREEEVCMVGVAEPLRLPRRSVALRMLQRIRDEAHRFAVTYNRKRRTIRTVTSELLSIPGIGPARRTALLRTFGSLEGVRSASADQIAEVAGFSHALATRLLARLRADPATGVLPPVSGPDNPPIP